MKKILALMLAVVIVLALAGCCGTQSASSTGSSGDSSTSGGDMSSTGDASSDASYDNVTLTFTVANNEVDTGGMLVHFTDFITEKSGGAVQFDISYGGTLCSSAENLDFVSFDSVDM